MIPKKRDTFLGEILVSAGLLDEEGLSRGLELQKQTKQLLGEALVSLGLVSVEDIEWALSSQYQLPFIRPRDISIDRSCREIIPEPLAREFNVAPLFRTGSGLTLGDSLRGAEFTDVNVIGILPGADSALRGEAVIVGAHYDHLGVGTPVSGDSIYNGADDDASGVAAVLTAARELAAGPRPRRTVVFLLPTGEEQGVLGTQWYLRHPAVPLERTVADLEVEMIGRPDSLAGGPGRLWLTGYHRSTLGERLAAAGLPVVPDPYPDQHFFERSDNIVFAWRGIPAHTLSSYALHHDYHRPSDEIRGIDPEHLDRAAEVVSRAVRLLADGDPPAWHPGGRPAPPSE